MAGGAAQPTMQPQAPAQAPAQPKPAPTPAPKTTGTGAEDDPQITEIEDIGFSSSYNERQQNTGVNMQQQQQVPMPGMPPMGANGMPPNMADMMNNPMV